MKILVALDGSEAAYNTLRTACAMASRLSAYVTVFFVNKGEEYTPEQTGWISMKEKISDELESLGHEAFRKAREIGKELDTPVEAVISYGIPATEILRYADARGVIKLIAMGHTSKGKGTQEFVESTTKNVLARTKVPVLVTNQNIHIKRVLIAVDDLSVAKKAATYGGKLAKALGAETGILSVIPDVEAIIGEYRKIAEVPGIDKHIEESEKDLTQMAERAVNIAKDILASMDIAASPMIKKGSPSDVIISEAAHYDLLIIGLKGNISRKKIGTTANKLLDAHTINTIFMQ